MAAMGKLERRTVVQLERRAAAQQEQQDRPTATMT
jgi:hypothetical protein